MRRSYVFQFPILVICIFLAQGCSTTNVSKKAVKINGDVHYFNSDREIELTQAQLEKYEMQGDVVRVKHVARDSALIINPEEMNLLMQDKGIFLSEVDGVSLTGEVSALIKQGSLEDAVLRLIGMSGWESLVWDASSYYVPKPFAVAGEDLESVTMEALRDYPVFVKFNSKKKIVTVTDESSCKN